MGRGRHTLRQRLPRARESPGNDDSGSNSHYNEDRGSVFVLAPVGRW